MIPPLPQASPPPVPNKVPAHQSSTDAFQNRLLLSFLPPPLIATPVHVIFSSAQRPCLQPQCHAASPLKVKIIFLTPSLHEYSLFSTTVDGHTYPCFYYHHQIFLALIFAATFPRYCQCCIPLTTPINMVMLGRVPQLLNIALECLAHPRLPCPPWRILLRLPYPPLSWYRPYQKPRSVTYPLFLLC